MNEIDYKILRICKMAWEILGFGYVVDPKTEHMVDSQHGKILIKMEHRYHIKIYIWVNGSPVKVFDTTKQTPYNRDDFITELYREGVWVNGLRTERRLLRKARREERISITSAKIIC